MVVASWFLLLASQENPVLGGASDDRALNSATHVVAQSIDTENYSAAMRQEKASARAGTEAKVLVTFAAKGNFKINSQFPIKFKVGKAPEGVVLPKAVLRKEDAKLSENSGSFVLPFVATKPGTFALSGVLFVSFCNEKTCLMEKLPLETQVLVE